MARRRGGIADAFKAPKQRKRRGSGIADAFKAPKKGRGKKGGGIADAFKASKRGRGKKGGGIAAAFKAPKKGKRQGSLFNAFSGEHRFGYGVSGGLGSRDNRPPDDQEIMETNAPASAGPQPAADQRPGWLHRLRQRFTRN